MTSSKENASSLNRTTLSPLTLVAELGTGTAKSALPAQVDGSSMLTKSVLLFPTNAKLTLKTEIASPASRDMT
jgi:hypothetical protein